MQRLYSLEPVSEFIWSGLNGERTLLDILNSVVDAFDVERKQADDDLMEFIEELLKADLIVEVS